jgi:hypothetical protein
MEPACSSTDGHQRPEWAVALATFLLALGTVYLAKQARKEASAVRDEQSSLARSVQLQEQQAAAALRPVVYPDVSSARWVNDEERALWLPLTNGGVGVALNVRGSVEWWTAGDENERIESEILQTTIPIGGTTWARLRSVVDFWPGARGMLRYIGLSGKSGKLDSESISRKGLRFTPPTATTSSRWE